MTRAIQVCRGLVLATSLVVLVQMAVSDVSSAADPEARRLGELGGIPAPARETHGAHKPLFPLNDNDIWGIPLAILGLMVAAGGGIGGGGVLVPIYILVLRFSTKHAIAISNITIFGGSITNTVMNMAKRHPSANRPLVDWDLIMVMEPATIAGALIGSFLNKLLPEWLITSMLVLLLSATSVRTLKKAVSLYKKETIAMQGAKTATALELVEKVPDMATIAAAVSTNTTTLLSGTDADADALVRSIEKALVQDSIDTAVSETLLGDWGLRIKAICGACVDGARSDSLLIQDPSSVRERIIEDEQTTPLKKVRLLIIVFIGVFICNMLKGGGNFPSPVGIACGSLGFWVLSLITLPWIFFISWIVRKDLIEMYYTKEACGWKYLEGDIKWDEKATVKYPLLCSFAGLCAGMFGVGGGIVKGPLMLEMGVHPQVASATSACMILYTTSTATVSFWIFGLLQADYAGVLFLIGVVATWVGQTLVNQYIKRSGRNSMVVFSIGIVIFLSCLLMGYQGISALFSGTTAPPGSICEAGGE